MACRLLSESDRLNLGFTRVATLGSEVGANLSIKRHRNALLRGYKEIPRLQACGRSLI